MTIALRQKQAGLSLGQVLGLYLHYLIVKEMVDHCRTTRTDIVNYAYSYKLSGIANIVANRIKEPSLAVSDKDRGNIHYEWTDYQEHP
jgi:hypothetical protein